MLPITQAFLLSSLIFRLHSAYINIFGDLIRYKLYFNLMILKKYLAPPAGLEPATR